MTSLEIGQMCGWVRLPAEVERICEGLPLPLFSEAAPHLRGSGAGKDVFLWEAEEKVIGKILGSWAQGSVGTCVSMGWGRGAQDLMLVEIASGEPEEWPGAEVATEPIYGGSRVEVGGGRISGDGSVGAWAAKWVAGWGIMFRQKYGAVDLRKYSESLSRDWGRRGVPDSLEPVAKEHPVKTVSLVKSFGDLQDAVGNGYPVPACSDQGFTSQRNGAGFCLPKGQWNHCMAFRASCTAKGNKPCGVIQNSWGGYLSGPDVLTLESGREVKLPEGCFAAEAEVCDRMLRQNDSFAMSGFVGFPARSLNWLI